MDAQQVPYTPLLFSPEAPQQGTAALFGESGAVNPGPQFRQFHRFDGVLGEDMDILRQLQPGIGGFGRVVIVVAGGNKHRRRDLAQAFDQFFPRLVICIVTVQQVAGQKDNVRLLPPGQGAQGTQQFPLLSPADGGLAGAEPFKRRVQVQIGAVKNPQVAHVSLIPSAFKHFPVSGSMSNRHPSSLAGPLPDS